MKPKRSFGRRIGAVLRGLVLWPFAGIMAVLGIRIALISNPGRIGHMAAEMDAFLKERALGLIPPIKPILLLERKRAGNAALLDMFKSHVTVADKRWQKLLLQPFTKVEALRLPLGRPVVGFGECARYPQILQLWGDRPPSIPVSDAMQDNGRARLAEMGVPEGAWFVCVHVREGGYSPGDEQAHAHRNADVGSYHQAIEAITARGGWVIRVGDPTMQPLTPRTQVIDYARSAFKADWMDIWLCTQNRFFVGTTSGLTMLATMAHRPSVLVNMIPHGASFGMGTKDISIPKHMSRGGVPVPLKEVFETGLSVQRYADVFTEQGVEISDNSPEEIAEVVTEMLDRLDGTWTEPVGNAERQRRYRALLTPLDYSFGSKGQIGAHWLAQNASLLPE